MKTLICCLALSTCLIFGGRADAQSPAKCDSASILVSGHSLPPAFAHDWNAWRLVASCGSSGINIFISALASPQIATEPDLTRLGNLFGMFEGQLDGALFTAYTGAVFGNGGSDGFRIAAMQALVGMVEPAIEIRLPPVGSPSQSCGTASRMSSRERTASTLPIDAVDRVIATVSAVATSDASTRVRLAAACWQALLERESSIDVHKISIAYVCGDKFRIKNTNPNGVDLKFVVGNNLDSGEFDVPPRGKYDLIVGETGTLSIYLGSTLIGAHANGGAACK